MRELLIRSGRVAAAVLVAATLVACGSGSSKSDSSPTTVTGDTQGPPGGQSEDFCTQIRTYSARLAGLTQASATPDQVKRFADDVNTALQSAVTAAPAELKADVAVLTSAAKDYLANLQNAGYDLSKVPPDAAQAFQAPDVAAAANRVQVYAGNVCGARS